MKPIDITVNFNNCCCEIPATASFFAGLKVLEENNTVKINRYNMSTDFAQQKTYPHRYVTELVADGKTLVYDISDGYQDFDFSEVFDKQLDNIDFYFKSSYDPQFAQQLKNKDKFHTLAMSYGCSYPGNYFETAKLKNAIQSKSYKEALYFILKKKQIQAENDFRKLENNNHFDNYNLLYWTRLWEYDHITTEHIMSAYPTLDKKQAAEKAEQQITMLKQTNDERIRIVKLLRENFGDRFVGGLSDNGASRKEAPELITSDPRITTRGGYLDSLKQNYIHILSKGVHGCIGARYGETFASGRALITDPFVFEPAGNLEEKKNYLKYNTAEDVINCANTLLSDIETVHKIENNNAEYYRNFVRPDIRILNTLKIAFPEKFK